MAIGKIVKQILKLKDKKKTIDKFLSSGVGKKTKRDLATRAEKQKQSKLLQKSIDKLEKQKKQLPSSKKVSTAKPKVKRNIRDASIAIDYKGKMGSNIKYKSAKGKVEEFEKLVDKVEDLRAQGKIEEANKIMNSRKFQELADWDAEYAGRKSGGPIVKKPMGGKVYKNTVARKHGGAIGTGAALRGFGKGYKKG